MSRSSLIGAATLATPIWQCNHDTPMNCPSAAACRPSAVAKVQLTASQRSAHSRGPSVQPTNFHSGIDTIYDSILATIGRTPVVKINRLAPAHVQMYVKCEFFNPLSSVKDRHAIAIIEDAERRGTLEPGQTVVEATSGNTGIALAMVCAAKGYPFVAVMAESFSVERRKIMRILGAKVILTPAAERGSGMVRKAEGRAKKHGWFLARQFENEANPAYHRQTTGSEILSDFAGRRRGLSAPGWGPRGRRAPGGLRGGSGHRRPPPGRR